MFPVCLSEPDRHPYMDLLPHVSPQDQQRWHDFVAPLPVCSPTGPWIAGGAVRHFLLDEPHHDVDYFFASQQQYALTVADMLTRETTLLTSTTNHMTFAYQEYTVQLVSTRYRPSAFAHIDAFDFTLCQTIWDGEHLWMTPHAYHDLLAQRMNLVSPDLHSAIGTYLRVLKYTNQGYTISTDTLTCLIHLASKEYEKKGMNTDLTYGVTVPS